MTGMGLFPKPHTTLTDADVADSLSRAIAVINPLLDLLSQADPIGLRKRTHHLLRRPRPHGSVADRALNAGAHVLNAADLPGTAAWDQMGRDERCHWWVNRIGALNTLVVASPGVFGWLTRVVPVSELAGFVNQAIVLCAIAREYGVTERREQVRLLAEVLCRRQLPEDFDAPSHPAEPLPQTPPAGWKPLEAITSSIPVVVAKTVWQLAGILRATFDEVAKRPHPKKVYRWLSALPGLGAIATYFGERGALVRSAHEGTVWLAAHGH
jgi:hypothetical protein